MNITQKSEICTGCGMCAAICSSSAIQMQPDEHGFLHPAVDSVKCTDCGICALKCPVSTPPQISVHTDALTGYANDETLLSKSSSGAISLCWQLRLSVAAELFSAQRLISISMWCILQPRQFLNFLRFAVPSMSKAVLNRTAIFR